MLSPRIETDRLILRRYKESDIDAVYEIITDERLAKYIKYPALTKDEELECIGKWISEADFIAFVNSDSMIDGQFRRYEPYLKQKGYIK